MAHVIDFRMGSGLRIPFSVGMKKIKILTLDCNNMVISTRQSLSYNITTAISANSANLILGQNSLSTPNISQEIPFNLTNNLNMYSEKTVTRIVDYDDIPIGDIDPLTMGEYTPQNINPHIDIVSYADRSSDPGLVISAGGAGEWISYDPIPVSQVDEETIGTLDPDPVPDGIMN